MEVPFSVGKAGTQVALTGMLSQFFSIDSDGLTHFFQFGRTVAYQSNLNATGNAFTSIYGWTANPFVEYYIVDTWNAVNPTSPSATSLGSITVDGAVYDIAVWTRVGFPGITSGSSPPVPTAIRTLYSVRRVKRTSGMVDISKHVAGWAAAGYNLGSIFDFQIVACEAYYSTGTCSISIADSSVNPPPSSTDTTSTTRTIITASDSATSWTTPSSVTSTRTSSGVSSTATCAPKWGQCGGTGFSGPQCCQPGSTCTFSNNWYDPWLVSQLEHGVLMEPHSPRYSQCL